MRNRLRPPLCFRVSGWAWMRYNPWVVPSPACSFKQRSVAVVDWHLDEKTNRQYAAVTQRMRHLAHCLQLCRGRNFFKAFCYRKLLAVMFATCRCKGQLLSQAVWRWYMLLQRSSVKPWTRFVLVQLPATAIRCCKAGWMSTNGRHRRTPYLQMCWKESFARACYSLTLPWWPRLGLMSGTCVTKH